MPNQTFDYEDLRVTLTSELEWAWSDRGTGCKYACTIYHPKAQGDLCALGSVAFGHYNDVNGKRAVLLVGPKPNTPCGRSPAVARPIGWTSVWTDRGTGGKYDCTIWRPIAPAGYVSMGDVAVNSYNEPPITKVWCVRSDLVKLGSYSASNIWNDTGSGGKFDCSIWGTIAPTVGIDGAEKLPISADTFRAHQAYNKPDLSLAYVPLLDVKKDFKDFGVPIPEIKKDNLPSKGDTFALTEQCRVVLPFIAFKEPTDESLVAQIKTPFYAVSKRIAWKTEGVWYNDSNGQFEREIRLKYGVTKEQNEKMTNTVGVSISASAGIGVFQSNITLNYQFTSESSYGFSEFSEREVTEKFTVAARNATVLFSKHVWIRVTGADGSEAIEAIEIVANDDVYFKGCSL